jgi:hypothetical protein
MKKELLLAIFGFVICSSSILFSQSTPIYPPVRKETTQAVEITSLKPTDASPATFSSQEELDKTVPMKIAKIKEMIKAEKNDERIKILREDLWRFENAVVLSK